MSKSKRPEELANKFSAAAGQGWFPHAVRYVTVNGVLYALMADVKEQSWILFTRDTENKIAFSDLLHDFAEALELFETTVQAITAPKIAELTIQMNEIIAQLEAEGPSIADDHIQRLHRSCALEIEINRLKMACDAQYEASRAQMDADRRYVQSLPLGERADAWEEIRSYNCMKFEREMRELGGLVPAVA